MQTLDPASYGAKGDGVKLTDLVVPFGNLSMASSASASWTIADVGKMILITGAGMAPGGIVNGLNYAASVAPHSTTIASVIDAHTVTLATPATQVISGAKGAYGTDDSAAIRSAHLRASKTGRLISYRSLVYCLGRPLDCLSGTTVICSGELILFADPTAVGGMLVLKGNDDNFNWFGGIVNGGELTNVNGIAAAYDPGTGNITRNITIRPTLVTGCRMNLAMHAVYAWAGGGKGLTAQYHLDGLLFEGTIDGCDVGFTVEGAQGNNQITSNVTLRGVIKNCPFAVAVFAGSTPAGDSSTTIAGDTSTRYGQANIDITVDNCGTVAAIGTICGQFWSNWASHIRMRAFIRNGNAAGQAPTLWKGNVGHGCDIEIASTTDTLADGVDLSAYTGASLSAYTSYGASFRVRCESRATLTGALFRGALLESRIRLEADYLFPSAPTTLLASISSSATNTYRFFNRFLGQVREGSTAGSSSNLNGDPRRFSDAYVAIEKVLAYQPSATAPSTMPSGTQVALADGAVASSDGTVQSAGWGAAGSGQYVYRSVTATWGKVRTNAPAIDFTASATLTAAHADTWLTNNGAGARVDLTLPTPVANSRGALVFKAIVVAAAGMRFAAPAGVVISIPGVGVSSAGGYVQCTTVDGNLTVVPVSATRYVAVAGGAGWSAA